MPYAAGGSSDVLARLLGERLSKSLGQQIVIDNRAGAGSRLGIEIAAKSAPDGYTLLLADMPHTIIPAIQKGVHYDPVRDFTPIGLIGTASMFFFVNPAVKAETVQDFVALAKADPEKITIASGGIGSATHLTAELFQARAGIKLVHVPFRGAGPAMNDLVAGHVQSGFTTLATASSVLEGVRALAIASETRLATRRKHSDVQGRRHRSRRRALVGHARSGRSAAGDRRTPDGGPQSHSRLARVRDAPRAAGRHGVPCLTRAVPSPDRERHGALGRHRQVGRDQRPVTDAASTGRLLSPPVSPGDPLMWADFQALCDLGGRLAGSASEAAALAFAQAAARGRAGRKGSRGSRGISRLAVPDGATDQCDDGRFAPMHAASGHRIGGGPSGGSPRSRLGPT